MNKGLGRLKGNIGSLPREFVIALVVTIVAALVVPVIVSLLTKHKVYVWVLALAALVAFLAGLVYGMTLGGVSEGDGLKSRISELESRTGELGEYETYAEHVRDALGELRKVISKEMPSVSTRDFIEIGIFQPAHRLLHRDHRDAARGDVRFSILVADGDDFVMADESGLLPAHGHRSESRQRFRLPIKDSFAGVAYHSGRVQSSNDLAKGRAVQASPQGQLWTGVSVDGLRSSLQSRSRRRGTQCAGGPQRRVLAGRSNLHHTPGVGYRRCKELGRRPMSHTRKEHE